MLKNIFQPVFGAHSTQTLVKLDNSHESEHIDVNEYDKLATSNKM